MRSARRRFLRHAITMAVLPVASGIARAQTYPARAVRLVVGLPAGSSGDIIARLIGQWLSEHLGQTFVVENRPGAATNLATEMVIRAPADGYTLLVVIPSSTINATLFQRLNFDFLRDVAPVAGVNSTPFVMQVNAAFPAKTVPEFITYAKANPGKISMASGGIGSASHVTGELFQMMAGVKFVHVPYRGDGPALNDLLSGQVQVMFGTITSSIAQVRAGKLRALAVTTSSRSEALPDVPTVGEFLPGYEASGFVGIVAPANTPATIVEKLNKEINAALASPEIVKRFAELGGATLPLSPAGFRKLLSDETDKWAKVIKFSGAKAE